MPLYKVKTDKGAFIDNTLYEFDEIVELPEGVNPNWGVKCKADGTELESMSDKILNQTKMQEQLAKTIEGSESKQTQALAKENASLKGDVEVLKKQIADLQAAQAESAKPDPNGGHKVEDDAPEPSTEDTPPLETISEDQAQQLKEAVDMLEDANDEQWTARNEPKLDVIKDLTGIEISRAELDNINDRRRVKPE